MDEARPAIALTGATGFVGRAVARELARRGIAFTAVTRDRARAAGLGADEVIEADLASPDRETIAALARHEAVIHLAWGGLPNYRARRHFEVELPLHYAFLRDLVIAGAERLVVAGTCLEYGLREGALSENMVPDPVTAYGFAKDALRRELELLRREHPFALTWARLFHLHGEGQAPTSLFAQLTAALAEGRARFEMSGGEQVRDFSPIETVAARLVDLARLGNGVGVVNVASGRPRTVRRLVEEWVAARGGRIELDLGRFPYPDWEPFAFWADVRRLEAALGTGVAAGAGLDSAGGATDNRGEAGASPASREPSAGRVIR